MNVQIRLLLSTLALTVLIWTYADQASHESYTAVAVPVRLTSPPGSYDLRVEQADAVDNVILTQLTFRGTRSRIRELRALTEKNQFSLDVRVGEEEEPGRPVEMKLMPVLSDLPEVKERGLQLQHVSPPEITYTLLRYQSVAVQVRFDAGRYENDLAEPPSYEPERIRAFVLESDLGSAGTLPPLVVDIESAITEVRRRQADPEAPLTFAVPLQAGWPGIDARFEPKSIEVTCRVQFRSVSKQISLIPLQVQVRAETVLDLLSACELQWPEDSDLIQTVDVSGPSEKVNTLSGRQIDAFVRLGESDLPTGREGDVERTIIKPVEFRLPAAGFDDVEIHTPPATSVKIVIRRRDAAEAG